MAAAFISAAMTVRYDAAASVTLPDRLDATQLVAAANQTSFNGNEGQSLEVTSDGNSIRFVGSSENPDLSARTANAAATAFVDGLADADVSLSSPASVPTGPASPKRMRNALIGAAIGALIGLVLQASLRPPRVAESVTYIPTWTVIDDEEPAGEVLGPPHRDAVAASDFGAARPRPRAFQKAADIGATDVVDAEPMWADDVLTDGVLSDDVSIAEEAQLDNVPADNRPADDVSSDEAPNDEDRSVTVKAGTSHLFDPPEDLVSITIPGSPSNDSGDADGPTSEEPDGLHAWQEPAAELDVPDPPLTVGRGFRDLVERTSANLDPLIDRFAADDERFEADLDSLSTDSDADDGQLVGQIAFLGDEIAMYQRRMDDERSRHRGERDRLIADHEEELDALRAELDQANAEIERVSGRRDSARSQLEDRVTELETSLAAATDELERARHTASAESSRRSAASEDLVAEIEFMRAEVERYQRSLDEERVTHATDVAAARLENQEELDRIHREHRLTLNQLAETNRNLLMAQRNEAEAVMAELEADHQRALDEAHADYERRLTEARAHQSAQLSNLEDRTRSGIQAELTAEIEDLTTRLEAALGDYRTSQRRTSELASEIAASDRRVEKAQLAHTQAERRIREEKRQLERRSEELAELLARTEQRLANERRRTNEVVRNLLRESASAASAAEWARRSDTEVRDEVETEQRNEISQLQEQLRTLEQTAARRESILEATIAELRRQLGASPID